MKKRLLIALVVVLALAATASLVWGEPGTVYVDDDGICGGNSPCHTTIQAAVNAASPGDTVLVYAGTYTENVTVAKGLTLTAQPGATIDGGVWIKDLPTFVNPVTVDGFTIQNGTAIDATHDYCIKISGNPGLADKNVVDMHIVNNMLVNCGKTDNVEAEKWWNAAVFYDVNYFGTLGNRYDTIFAGIGEISHNTIMNTLADASRRTQLGIGVRSGRNMKINDNNISGNVAEGIHHWGPVNTVSTGNYEMDHNYIDLAGWIGDRIGNNPRGIWSYARHSSISYNTVISKWYGIVVSYWDDTNWGGATAADYPVTISHNVIHPPAGETMTAGLRYGGNNSQITNNEIYGATDTSGYGVGLLFEGFGVPAWGERTECAHNTFTRNDIHDNYDGIWTWGDPYDNTFDNVFHYNNIVNNSNSGMTNNHVGETVNAECNWWGAANGPGGVGLGSGDAVSADVDFEPWLVAAAPEGTCTGPDNQGPITSAVVAAPNPAPVSTAISLSANVDDSTTGGSHIASAKYNVDDGNWNPMSAQDGDFNKVSEDVTATIGAFQTPGVHEVCVRGTDVPGNPGEAECILLAVYDPTAGFVTGGGWIWSEPGAYRPNQALEGKATFGFVSRYQKGATAPTGRTEFQFKVADLNFHSSSYDWLVIAGARAQYKGTGTINGTGDYGFMLTAIDGALPGGGDADKFRIKIWDKADDSLVYDNQFGADDTAEPSTVIGGGSIVIHKK